MNKLHRKIKNNKQFVMIVVYILSKSLSITYSLLFFMQFISIYTNIHFYNLNKFLLD